MAGAGVIGDNHRAVLPERLYTAAQTRALDRSAIEGHGVPGYTLMTRAGRACWAALSARWPGTSAITVYCGAGNNGGDGYVIAEQALAAGIAAEVVTLSDPGRLSGDAARAHADFIAAGGETIPFEAHQMPRGQVLVDALLGTGLTRPVEGAYAEAVERINAAGRPVLSVDIPSGLSADRGAILGCAVRAAATVTFIGLKRGLVTGDGLDCAGALSFEDLEVPAAIYAEVASDCALLQPQDLRRWLTPRRRNAHKGRFGSVLVVGGDHGMPGAVRLAGEAALRSGAGLVRVATRAEHALIAPMGRPELMSVAVEDAQALAASLEWASVVALGPGLGASPWSREMFTAAAGAGPPLVVDADALNWLAREPRVRDDWVLTPHPGEAARLLGSTSAEVQADRFAAAAAIAARYHAVCVLKGAGTVIADPAGGLAVCRAGNPGMASAGMGDVLTGIIAALLGQGLSPWDAARCGALAHATAGDQAAADGERGLIAGDVLAALRPVLNPRARS